MEIKMRYEYRPLKYAPFAQRWFYKGTAKDGSKFWTTTNGAIYVEKNGKWFKAERRETK